MPCSACERRLEDLAHRLARIERSERVLEHHLHPAMQRAAVRGAASCVDVAARRRRMLPAVGGSRPTIMRASVDLPQPDSPTMPSVRPRGPSSDDAVDRAQHRPRRAGTGAGRRRIRRTTSSDARTMSAHAAAAPARMQRAQCSSPTGPARSRRRGTRASASSQRGAKAQPGGSALVGGGRPGIGRIGRSGRPSSRHAGEQALRIGVRAARRAPSRPCRSRRSARHTSRGRMSQSSAITPTSWLMNTSAAPRFAAKLVQQRQHLRLGGDVQRRGRLVGDDDLGIVGERHGDADALALAAGELVRIGVRPVRRRRGSAPNSSSATARGACLGAAEAPGGGGCSRRSARRPASAG